MNQDTHKISISDDVKVIAPGLAHYTGEVLFGDLWRRPGLNDRDRSLVTVAALVAGGQLAPLQAHIDRGLSNGITAEEIGEIITHLAFYSGWPRAVEAVGAAKAAFAAVNAAS